MKKKTIALLFGFISLTSIGQDVTGEWNGLLNIQGIQLRLVFHIHKTDNGLSATMDSPDQGAKNIPVTSVQLENTVLKLSIAGAKIEYEGIVEKDTLIVGTFKQLGKSFPMNLSRRKVEKEKLVRPQEPTLPYPYYSEEVTFENANAQITLAGTLTLPKKEGVFPVVILISGSGPQNRDEEILGHKPFLILADYLTKNGIAVLRYDDRGTAASTGKFNTATSLDFVTDAEAALGYLKTRKEINTKKMGVIGHSEGGMIAPMLASKSNDVAFIVLLAGTGIQGDQLLLLQQKLIGKASGMSEDELLKNEKINRGAFEIIKKATNTEKLKMDLSNYLKETLKDVPSDEKPAGMSDEDMVNTQINQLMSPWMRYFITYNPAPTLEKVKCPVLALNGEKDLQVPPKENLAAIKKALIKGGNKRVTMKELPNLNHLFQECVTGSPSEYSTLTQTFSPIALTEIVKWIATQTK
jgi:pimeloyl-ACP methyl ester carboxylesterase